LGADILGDVARTGFKPETHGYENDVNASLEGILFSNTKNPADLGAL
jgi:hypothetical protein